MSQATLCDQCRKTFIHTLHGHTFTLCTMPEGFRFGDDEALDICSVACLLAYAKAQWNAAKMVRL